MDARRQLPESFKKLPADDNWKDVKANLPGKAIAATAVPRVFVSNTPAELLLLTGEPRYAPVTGTGLMWVSNTDSDVFRLGKTGPVYYVVAGRWFSAPDFTGPWTFATPSLPSRLQEIPLEHERSRVLASVPGTNQAAEAVLLAQIPQTARVTRRSSRRRKWPTRGTEVRADRIDHGAACGEHRQGRLQGRRVLLHVHQGVWFVGTSPTGPWEVAELGAAGDLPDSRQLPGPSRHLRDGRGRRRQRRWRLRGGGRLHGHDDGLGLRRVGLRLVLPAVLRLRRLSTRTATGTSRPTAIPPGTARGPAPTDAAPPSTDRTAAPASARATTRATGTYARGAAAYGPYGGPRREPGLQPAHRRPTGDASGIERLRQLGSTAVQRGDDWAKTNRYTNNRTGNTTRTIRTDEGGAVTRRGDQRHRRGRRRRQRLRGAGTATSIAAKTAPGRTRERQLVDTDRQPTGDRPTPQSGRAGTADREHAIVAARSISSTAIRRRAPRVPSARVTTAAIRAAADRAAGSYRAAAAAEPQAAAAVGVVVAAEDDERQKLGRSLPLAVRTSHLVAAD